MLPDEVIQHFTLAEASYSPALSLYLDVSDDFTVMTKQSKIEMIQVDANLRHDSLEQLFNEETLRRKILDYPFAKELELLWNFAKKMEALRGKENDINNEKIDYSFLIDGERITIQERRRGSPIDKVVSELMIYTNTEWGKQLAEEGIAAIYRNQSSGKVRMSLSPAPHQGLGVSHILVTSGTGTAPIVSVAGADAGGTTAVSDAGAVFLEVASHGDPFISAHPANVRSVAPNKTT